MGLGDGFGEVEEGLLGWMKGVFERELYYGCGDEI